MTGFLNPHGTNPNLFGGDFIAFPDKVWEHDEPVAVEPNGYVLIDDVPCPWQDNHVAEDPFHFGAFDDQEEEHDPFDPRHENVVAWAERQYGHLPSFWPSRNVLEHLGEHYEQLPLQEAVSVGAQLRAGDSFAGDRARQPHRKGRSHVCNQNHIAVRRERQKSHRQMDAIWWAEMTEPSYALHEQFWGDVDETEQHLTEINDELWGEYEYELLRTEQHWQWQHPGPMTEALQNCHGFIGDPLDESLPESEYQFDPFSGHCVYDGYDFWGCDEYDDPMDRYEFGVLTEEEEAQLDAEATAKEATADALEAAFEHLAASNATGRRAQLAHARVSTR